MAKIRMPDDFGQAAQMLWRLIVDRDPPYVLRPDEQYILIQACYEADIIRKLELALAEDMELHSADGATGGLTTKGSMGQQVISPFVSELRQHRQTLASLLKSLKLPEDKSGTGEKKVTPEISATRRAAARERWKSTKEA